MSGDGVYAGCHCPLSGRKALHGVLRAGETTARAPSALGGAAARGPARALGATPGL